MGEEVGPISARGGSAESVGRCRATSASRQTTPPIAAAARLGVDAERAREDAPRRRAPGRRRRAPACLLAPSRLAAACRLVGRLLAARGGRELIWCWK